MQALPYGSGHPRTFDMSRGSPLKVTRVAAIAGNAGADDMDVNLFPVVGIGASAGGLEACSKLVEALPAQVGMAFILIQHLDPAHASMMVDLLGRRTPVTVCEAADGMVIQSDHLYVIPPAVYLSVANGALHLSEPEERHGARLPFDFLLHSMARELGPRAICVILSGTGADGSLGLKSIKERGGFAIAQDPEEAAFDGMPRSAIATGLVDLVLRPGKIPNALVEYAQRKAIPRATITNVLPAGAGEWLQQVILLLRTKTNHDFILYKPGTLQRRIERRMAMSSIPTHNTKRYLDILQNNKAELTTLATDLLINVTGFFRDPSVFEMLCGKIIPGMILSHTSDQPLRIWSAGCSTGEEAYSIAILFFEAIATSGRNIKLQIFASDVDPDAIAAAREGHYPDNIRSHVSQARLARFFTETEKGFKVSADLRDSVVFTIHDILSDPPFSRLDMILCRNLLIYLQPEAQQKMISQFHFALREGAILVLGSAETAGNIEGRFKIISKNEHLYQHIGGRRLAEFDLSAGNRPGLRVPVRPGAASTSSRHAALAELCQHLVLENYAPTAVLVNSKLECI